MKKLNLLILLISISLLAPISVAEADTYGYKFIDGVTDKHYNVPPNVIYTHNGTTKDYEPFITYSINIWNLLANNENTYSRHVDVSFFKSTSYAESEVIFAVYDVNINVNVWAFTNYYKEDGTPASNSQNGSGPYVDYSRARISLDVSNLHDMSNAFIRKVTTHEMGHALGLAHSTTESPANWSVMKSDVHDQTDNPTDYDITQLNGIY